MERVTREVFRRYLKCYVRVKELEREARDMLAADDLKELEELEVEMEAIEALARADSNDAERMHNANV